MGRSVHEHHVGLSREQEDELALGAVADEAGVSLESLRANLRRLERLCPPLVARRERSEVQPARLARLALDLDAVASSMMRLKVLLPNADVAEMCARRPALLGAEAVDRAVAVAAIVGREYPRRFVVPGTREEKEDVELDAETSIVQTRALLASVPDILLEPRDDAVLRIVTRARALRFLLPDADVARIAGKRPSFLLTSDAGLDAARGGRAAGLEAVRTHEARVPKHDASAKEKHRKRAEAKAPPPSGDASSSASWFERWHVAVSAREVRRRMPEDCDVGRLLTDFPNILAMDVPALFEDLRAVFPTRDPADVLRTNPKIAYQVSSRTSRAGVARAFFFPFFRDGVAFSSGRSPLARSSRHHTRSWRKTPHARGLCVRVQARSRRGRCGDTAPVFCGDERETSRAPLTFFTSLFFPLAPAPPSQFERNTASAAPMGPAANTTQAFEANAGLMTVEALEALGAEKRRERRERG